MGHTAAGCTLTGLSRIDPITPILQELQWLPVCFHVQFNVFVLVCKALYGVGLRHLKACLDYYVPARPLR